MVTQRGNILVLSTDHTKNLDTKTLIEDLEKIPWSILDLLDDEDDAIDIFVSLFEDVLNDHIPWREKRVKNESSLIGCQKTFITVIMTFLFRN